MERAGTSSEDFRFKVILLGESAVGKSSLVMRYTENRFTPEHISTVQASFQSKHLSIDGYQIKLNIWDTAGQEMYHALVPMYYRGSNGALLVYDITDQQSFERGSVKTWVKELQRALGDTTVLMIIGNKIDLIKNRTVDENIAREYASSVGVLYEETSAKKNFGISQVFEKLCQLMIAHVRDSNANQQNDNVRSRRIIELVEDEPTRNITKCCK